MISVISHISCSDFIKVIVVAFPKPVEEVSKVRFVSPKCGYTCFAGLGCKEHLGVSLDTLGLEIFTCDLLIKIGDHLAHLLCCSLATASIFEFIGESLCVFP